MSAPRAWPAGRLDAHDGPLTPARVRGAAGRDPLVRVAVALGSNLGDRERVLTGAIAALVPVVSGIRASRFYETPPVGVDPQPDFLNGALVGTVTASARDLLDALLAIEARFGRERPHPGAPRTLDLDLILYGNQIIDEPGLVVPHPRFRERRFVLEPLADVAAEWIDPVTGLSVAALLARHALGRRT